MISRQFLFLGLLALSSCQKTQPAVTPAPLSIYELELNPVDGQPAQIIKAGGLQFTLYSSGTLVENTERLLHLTATFTVTNVSTTVLQAPTYIPVVTKGTYATLGDTPFRNVLTRKSLAVVPADIRIETARRLSGTTVIVDPDATPLVGSLKTSALKLALPDNPSVVRTETRGWQAPLLKPGASQQITFTVQIPLEKQDIRNNDPFRVSLVLTAADAPTLQSER